MAARCFRVVLQSLLNRWLRHNKERTKEREKERKGAIRRKREGAVTINRPTPSLAWPRPSYYFRSLPSFVATWLANELTNLLSAGGEPEPDALRIRYYLLTSPEAVTAKLGNTSTGIGGRKNNPQPKKIMIPHTTRSRQLSKCDRKHSDFEPMGTVKAYPLPRLSCAH